MVQVHLDLSRPHQHLVGVSLRLQPRLSLMQLRLPGWTPGSYLIRDYVRQLEGLHVEQDGVSLAVQRLGPAAWQITADPQAGELLIRYRVLATEATVRTCHLDQHHGFLALAAVVMEVEGERWNAHHLQLQLPGHWHAFVPLPEKECGWFAGDFDQLIDAPVEVGPHRVQHFAVAGVPHRWVCWAGAQGADQWLDQRYPDLLQQVQQVCEACCNLMGSTQPAAEHYLFVLHLLDEAYGGLEHDNSTVLVYGRRNFLKPNGYRRFLQLVAHEYLHQWNVRRLKPAELSPIDYHQPVVVPTLWFAEGVTSYLDQFLPVMAGLTSSDALLEDLGEDLSRYRLTPGRHVQSLSDSSREAWVKLYKADAYAPDSQVSYYLKGAVVALCLDLHLRQQGSSLVAVLRRLWTSHGCSARGYQEQDLLAAFAAEAEDLLTLLPRWLHELDDPDLDGYLSGVGLQLEPVMATHPWTGFTARVQSGQLLVSRVWRSAPAEQAGLMVGDEILALDQERLLQPEQLEVALRSDQPQKLLIARCSQLHELELSSAPAAVASYRLSALEHISELQQRQQQHWLLQRSAALG